MQPDLRSDETKYLDSQIEQAVKRERESCARIAESFTQDASGEGEVWVARRIADVIRERK